MKMLKLALMALLFVSASAHADQPSEDLVPGVAMTGKILQSRSQTCWLRVESRDIEELHVLVMVGSKDNLHVLPLEKKLTWNGLEHKWTGEAFGEEGALSLLKGNNGQYILVQQVSQYPDRRFPNPAYCEFLAR